MASGKEKRRAYLDAMGIQTWVRRESRLPAASEKGAGTPHAPPADSVSATTLQSFSSAEEEIMRMDWDALRARVLVCTRCELHKQRTQAVFGVGGKNARWMVIGEGPGADEDRQGEPFVGRAGKLLDNMLRAIGLAREEVYIANIVKCRPPNNRDPKPEEAAACEAYLRRQIELVKPRIILALGRIAAQNLLKTDRNVGALRGRALRYGETGIPVAVTYHPAYLLRSPQEKRKAWQDLLHARAVCAEHAK